MVSKVVLLEFEKLKARLATLRASLSDTTEANRKKEIEYVEGKKHYQSEIRRLANEHNCLDKTLSELDSEITDYELKLKTSFAERSKKEAECKDYKAELGKVKEGTNLMEKTYDKKIQKLNDEIQVAKAKLNDQLRLEEHLEKNFCAALQAKKNEIEGKVKNQQKSFEGKLSKLEDKYNSKAEPLLVYMERLDTDISHAETELEEKPKEIENLKKEAKLLENKYEKAFEARLMNESVATGNALMKGLKYFRDRPGALTSDTILGILIVRANLQWISDRLHHNKPFSNKLESLLKQCDDIVNSNHIENYPVLGKGVWDNAAEDLKWGNFNMENYQHLLPKFESCESIDSYFMRGTPEDSDFCITELITSDCKVSKKCWFSETNNKPHSGYKTSHRFFYFLIATQLKCDEKNENQFHNMKKHKRYLCQRMLLEAKALFEEPHFAVTRDLFLEHVALCGLEGYEEFAPYLWRENVRSWQNSEGCFGYEADIKHCQIADRGRRVKRTDTELNGCHTHVTAVALSSLAFFLRYTAEATFLKRESSGN